MVDPDSRVSGQGLEMLRNHGVQVEVGIEGEDCMELNKAFVHRIKTSHPYSIAAIKMQRINNDNDSEKQTFTHQVPTRVELEDMFPKAIPDVDTIVISFENMQKWTTGKLALPNHVDFIITALDMIHTPEEIQQMRKKISGFGRKVMLLTKVEPVHGNVNGDANASLNEHIEANDVQIMQYEEAAVDIETVFDVLRGTQSNAVLHIIDDVQYLIKLKENNYLQELLIFANIKPDIKYLESVIDMTGIHTSRSKSRDIIESFKCVGDATDGDPCPEVNTLLIKL